MRDTPTSDRLELITLNDTVVSFSRLFANTVRYHHWHQCLEILYVEEGFGVAIVDNRHYTMRPGRLFFFPPFTLHKVRWMSRQKRFTDVPLFISTLTRCLQPCAIFPTRSSGCRNFLPAAPERGLPIWRTAITMSIICSAVTRRL